MTAYADIAVAVLAAGEGRRFGSDKLMADLGGHPLGLSIARTLAPMAFGWRFAVCRENAALRQLYSAAKFEVVANDNPEHGQSHSLHLAVRAAEQANANALLVVLADMPFVSARHIANLVAAHDGDIVASTNGTAPTPPVIFPRDMWPNLLLTKGDNGGRGLLQNAKLVSASPAELRDIDVAADLPKPPHR